MLLISKHKVHAHLRLLQRSVKASSHTIIQYGAWGWQTSYSHHSNNRLANQQKIRKQQLLVSADIGNRILPTVADYETTKNASSTVTKRKSFKERSCSKVFAILGKVFY